jgi:DNA (cytosine-5)-methyltransferase 1
LRAKKLRKSLKNKAICLTRLNGLQGFINYGFINEAGEDQFSFPEGIPDVQRYKQFGNSVTIPVIQTMAEFMLECIGILGEA